MQTHILRFGRNWRMALFVAVTVLYLPFSWLLLIHYPWDAYRVFWLKLWCILPGFLSWLMLHPMNETVEFIAMGITTVFLIGLLTWIGSHNRNWLIIAGVVGLALETYLSLIAYAVFRA